MSFPYFSILIPLYNKERYIETTLHSVLQQKFSDFEILIIDDGSIDGSAHIVAGFKDIRIHYIHTKNNGASSARNLGIEKATGKYIAFLDADDFWYPDHLSSFKESIELYPDHHVFCNNYTIQLTHKLYKETNFSYLPSNESIVLIKNFFKSSLLDSVAWTSAVCIRSLVFETTQKFDTSIISGQDTDLWIRLGLKYAFVFNTKATAIYKKLITNSLSKSNLLDSRSLVVSKYKKEEEDHVFFKKFMDQQRFSMCLQYKILNDLKTFGHIKSEINLKNLNGKQKFLLDCSPQILKVMFALKRKLAASGFNLSVFK